MQDVLHQLDLQQIEKMRKLQVRLNTELATYDRYLAGIALQESRRVWERLGISPTPEDGRPSVQQSQEQLEEEQVKVLLSMKMAIWDTSNTLKQLHDKRKVVTAQEAEVQELNEER